MCSLHTQGKDFEIHEDILKAIYVFIKRRLKRFFILVLGITLSDYLDFTLFRILFRNHESRHGNSSSCHRQPTTHIARCLNKPEITSRLLMWSQRKQGKHSSQRIKQTGFLEKNLDVVVSQSMGIPQSVLKNAATQIKQVQSLGRGAASIDFNKSWVTQETTDVSQGTMLFYTAIASFTMYSLFSGVVCAAYLNGNLSPIGRRIMGSPFSKGKLIANCFMIGLLLNIASNAIMLVYTTQVLKIIYLQIGQEASFSYC